LEADKGILKWTATKTLGQHSIVVQFTQQAARDLVGKRCAPVPAEACP
jgi:hypothetical protein